MWALKVEEHSLFSWLWSVIVGETQHISLAVASWVACNPSLSDKQTTDVVFIPLTWGFSWCLHTYHNLDPHSFHSSKQQRGSVLGASSWSQGDAFKGAPPNLFKDLSLPEDLQLYQVLPWDFILTVYYANLNAKQLPMSLLADVQLKRLPSLTMFLQNATFALIMEV